MNPFRYLLLGSLLLANALTLRAEPPSAPVSPPAAQQGVLNGLIGKHSVIGFTERGGRRFLGRVLSGDHGLYVIQTFHYAAAPTTSTETTPQTTYVLRRRRLVPQTKQVKTQVTIQKTLADTVAVQALLRGVAGPSFRPGEQPAGRELLAPSDVLCLQQLSPPSAAQSSAQSSAQSNWTIKTLWASPELKSAPQVAK